MVEGLLNWVKYDIITYKVNMKAINNYARKKERKTLKYKLKYKKKEFWKCSCGRVLNKRVDEGKIINKKKLCLRCQPTKLK